MMYFRAEGCRRILDNIIVGAAGAVSIILMILATQFMGIQMDIITMYGPAILLVLYLVTEGEEGIRCRGWVVWSTAIIAVTLALIALYSLF